MTQMFARLGTWFAARGIRSISDEEFQREREKILAQTPVPVFWLFGKTGSGKTSIVKYLTGAQGAVIGHGFRPETTRSYRYDFPAPDNPVLKFLDTRGLGEIHYDPAEDIREFDRSTHLIIVTVRITDHSLDSVVEPLRRIRRAQPHRPILLTLTTLHQLYPGQQHPNPDPFESPEGSASLSEGVLRSIAEQKRRFEGLVDAVVPIDLTPREEGFDEPEFGGERLKRQILEMLPAAYRQTFLTLESATGSLRELHELRATPYVLSASMMAATAAAVPVPWIDIPVVAGIQTDLVRRLAILYGQQFDVQRFLKIAGAVGGRLVVRQAVREVLKFIPGVGQAANATLAFVYTYGLGKACCWYFGEILAGHAPTQTQLQENLKEQMSVAREIWSNRKRLESEP